MGMFDDLIPTGDESLKNRTPEDIVTIKGLAGYKINPNSLSIKGGHRERLIGGALQYDKDYDQTAYPAKAAAVKEFNAGGPSSPAGQIMAGNTAIQHLGDLADSAEKLKAMPGFLNRVSASGLPFVSYAAALLNNASLRGTPEGKALADYMTARNHFSEEVTKFYAGSAGSEAERERALNNIDPAKSIEELRGAFHTEAKLVGGKVNALQTRFQNALGPKAWLTAIEGSAPEFPIVQKRSADVLKQLEDRVRPKEAAMPQGAAPPATAQPGAPDQDGWITMPTGIRIREVPSAAK